MKPKNIWEMIVLIFTIMVVYIFIVSITSMVVSKIPTTADNEGLRKELADQINTIIGFIMGIVAKKIYDDKTKNE
jgi:hypothetical protein